MPGKYFDQFSTGELIRHDVTRTVTYVTDMKAYFEAIDERWNFFKEPLPTSTVLGVSSLGVAEMMVEIEVEAAIDSARLRIPKQ